MFHTYQALQLFSTPLFQCHWVRAICDYFAIKKMQCLQLVELVDKVQYQVEKQPDIGSRLVKTWIALLIGEFQLEQQDFYDLEGIKVSLKRSQ